MRPPSAHFTPAPPDRRRAGRALACVAGVAALVAAGLTAVSMTATAATAPCQVTYSVTGSWPGGFQAGITITNNGSAITGWTLAFAFPGDQQVASGWSGTWTQSGHNVTVASASWNGALGTGASTSLGFTGTSAATVPPSRVSPTSRSTAWSRSAPRRAPHRSSTATTRRTRWA